MLSIAQCPRCDERVRVPEIDGPAEVRCPWCGSEFALEEVTRYLPPVLEVISVLGHPYKEVRVPDFSDDSEEYRFQSSDSDETVGTTNGPFASAPDFSHSERMSPAVTSRPRPKRRRESPFLSFLKMAGGGVAGILIALLILQAMGRVPNLGFWPFQGPNTKLIPRDLFGVKSSDSSGDSLASNDTSDSVVNQSRSSELEPIDLGVPNFDKLAENDSTDAADPMDDTADASEKLDKMAQLN